jgi:hypothetical protein
MKACREIYPDDKSLDDNVEVHHTIFEYHYIVSNIQARQSKKNVIYLLKKE